MTLEDKKLQCRDCGKEFIWSIGEQRFFAEKGFSKEPVRCPECRKKKKERGKDEQLHSVEATLYQIKCKKCAKTSEIPFQPRNPENILCSQCFEASLGDNS